MTVSKSDKNPVVILTVEATIKLILQEKSVQAAMIKACKNFTPTQVERFVKELAKKSEGYATIPDDLITIQISGKGKVSKAEILKRVSKAPKHYVEILNDIVYEARVVILKQDRSFIKRFVVGTAAYNDLISLWKVVEDIWKDIGPTNTAKNRVEFYKVYIDIVTPLLRNKRKFSIKAYLDANVQSEAGSILSEYYKVAHDKYKDYTLSMIGVFMKITDRSTDIFSNNIKYRYKFLIAFELLMEARSTAKDSSAKASEKYIPLWIESQLLVYNNNFSGQRNIDIELGYLCGPGAIDRYIEYRDKVKKEVKSKKKSIPKINKF